MSIKRVQVLKWVDQFTELTASNFHNKVRSIFASDEYFKRFKCYQEVAVKDLVPTYPYINHHYDWYIPKLNTVIELHGRQHYQMVNFGSIGYDEANQNFINMRERDHLKQIAAQENGYRYVEIPYKAYAKLNAATLKKYILGELNDNS